MNERTWTWWGLRTGFPVLYAVVIGSQLYLRQVDPTSLPTPNLLFPALSLVQTVLVLLLSTAIGRWILRRFLSSVMGDQIVLRLLISSTLGLGILSSLISMLGFLQVLTPLSIHLLSLFGILLVADDVRDVIRESKAVVRVAWGKIRAESVLVKALMLISLILILITLINTLTPPWDYDGLMYHLLGPAQFLEKGGFFPNLENWYVNGPFSVEMLFTLGLSLGDDIFPKLIHFAYWGVLCVATFEFGKRWFGDRVGFIGLALLLGVPALPIWASFAYIDIAWSVYEFLAFGCLMLWWEKGENGWLLVSGAFTGLGMSSKYLGLYGALIVGLLYFYIVGTEKRSSWVKHLAMIGLPVLLFAGPWYLKNLLWLNNPVYPLLWGGPAWDSLRLELYNTYLGTFGMGTGIFDLILLPWNVYAHNEAFGAVFNRNDIPNLLFLLAPLALLTRKYRLTRLLAGAALLRILLWFFGSQQLRFLLPIYPTFAILAGVTIEDFNQRIIRRESLRILLPSLSIALIVIPLFYQVQIMRQYHSLTYISGKVSREAFLENAVGDYGAASYIRDTLPGDARVLMLGNGRGYYCYPKCIPDPDHFHMARQLSNLDPQTSLHHWIIDNNGSHLLISFEDLDFLLQHDGQGVMENALKRVAAIADDSCFQEVYKDVWTQLYENVCTGS